MDSCSCSAPVRKVGGTSYGITGTRSTFQLETAIATSVTTKIVQIYETSFQDGASGKTGNVEGEPCDCPRPPAGRELRAAAQEGTPRNPVGLLIQGDEAECRETMVARVHRTVPERAGAERTPEGCRGPFEYQQS